MKNLQPYVDRIWAAGTIEDKKSIMHEMVQASTATRKTKVLTGIQIDKCNSLTKLDSLAVNYSFSGMGMKVI